MSWAEFEEEYASLVKGKKHRDDAQWYWDRFVQDPLGEMVIEEFRQGYRLADPDVTEGKI